MIYLASPYSHPDPAVRWMRFRAVALSASRLMGAGVHLYCPITHTHPIAVAGALPLGWDFWGEYDRWFITRCDGLVVVKLDGWEESTGVRSEIKMGVELEKVLFTINPGDELSIVPQLLEMQSQ